MEVNSNKKCLLALVLFLQVDLVLLSTVELLLALSALSFLVGCFILQCLTWCDWKLTNQLRLDQVFSSTRWRRCLECDVFSKIDSKRYFDARWIRFCSKLTYYDRKITVFLMFMLFYSFVLSSELDFGLNSKIMLYQEFNKITHRWTGLTQSGARI